MRSAPKPRDKIEVADVVVSTNHVTFRANRFPTLNSLPTSAIFVSGTSSITAILKYRSVNPMYIYIYLYTRPLKNGCPGYDTKLHLMMLWPRKGSLMKTQTRILD